MDLFKINLQLFGEGGGDGAGGADGASSVGGEAEGQSVSEVDSRRKGRRSNPLANVRYGIQDEEQQIAGAADGKADTHVTTKTNEEKSTEFENLIKGEYKEFFDQRVHDIINNRFKNQRENDEQIQKMQPILEMLASKYGADITDVDAISKAIQEDDSYYEDEALKRGLSVKQLKEMKKLERENNELRTMREQIERQQTNERINAQWLEQTNALNAKYGLNVDFSNEIQNPDFRAILGNGGSIEAAYMATHFDEMLGGAMAQTAQAVTQKMANNIQSRSARPSENGISSRATVTTKTDVKSLTRKDREEIERRAARGEIIRFG